MATDSYLIIKALKAEKNTFIDAALSLANDVANNEIHYYTAIMTCAHIVETCWVGKFFSSPSRAAITLKRMIQAIDDKLKSLDELSVTAEQIPEHLLYPHCFSLKEAIEILGNAYIPSTRTGNNYPAGRAIVTTINMIDPGNFVLGLHWGTGFSNLTTVNKDEFTTFTLRS